jgi:hypothetical protein
MINIGDLVLGIVLPPLWGGLLATIPPTCRYHGWRTHFWVFTGMSAAGGIVGTLFDLHRFLWYLPGYLFWVTAAIWFFTRRRRERAAKLIGAKTRALRDALARKAREAGQPRPVLRPVPVRS